MGGGDDGEESEDDGWERKITPYNNKTKGLFMLFSPFSHTRFFRRLEYYLRERDVASQRSATQWQMTFKVEEELDDEQIENGVEPTSCEIKVELLKMDG
jgi:hypothetical protein